MTRHRFTRPQQRRRRRRRSGNILGLTLLTACSALLIYGVTALARDRRDRHDGTQQPVTDTRMPTSAQLQIVKGNPSDDRIMIEYTGFTVAFNPVSHIPDYVAWELTPDKAAGTVRRGNFSIDPDIIGSADPSDYRATGFDRGHLAPAGDMKWSREAMNDCFRMTNIAPQTSYLNQRPWNNLEKTTRRRTAVDSLQIIIAGPVPGEPPLGFIGPNRVAIPARYFKVILAPDPSNPHAIGFIMDNSTGKQGVQEAAMTVDQVEQITGYDFFSALPDDIEQRIESTADYNAWSRNQ